MPETLIYYRSAVSHLINEIILRKGQDRLHLLTFLACNRLGAKLVLCYAQILAAACLLFNFRNRKL
jgi:hypothetical protein